MVNKISFNGTEYSGPDEMPPAIREAYQRALDLAKEGSMGGLHTNFKVNVSTKMRFVHDGKTYDSIDAMPPEVRAKYEAAMSQLDRNHNGLPDFLEGTGAPSTSTQLTTPDQPVSSFDTTPAAPLSPQPSVIEPDRPGNSLLIIGGIVIVLLLLVVAGLVIYVALH